MFVPEDMGGEPCVVGESDSVATAVGRLLSSLPLGEDSVVLAELLADELVSALTSVVDIESHLGEILQALGGGLVEPAQLVELGEASPVLAEIDRLFDTVVQLKRHLRLAASKIRSLPNPYR